MENGDVVYRVVKRHGGRGWYVNSNRWSYETNCYAGWMRDTEARFATRFDAEAYIRAQQAVELDPALEAALDNEAAGKPSYRFP